MLDCCRRYVLASFFAALGSSLSARAQIQPTPLPALPQSGAARASAPDQSSSTPSNQSDTRLSKSDLEFLQKAIAAGHFEVEAAKVGVGRGVDPAVKSLAQALVAQHEMLNKELSALSSQQGATKVAAISREQQATVSELQKTEGFDTVFVRKIGIEAHQRDIALFEAAEIKTRNPQLKSWLKDKLTILRDHLATAQQIPLRNAGGKTPNSSSGPAPAAR